MFNLMVNGMNWITTFLLEFYVFLCHKFYAQKDIMCSGFNKYKKAVVLNPPRFLMPGITFNLLTRIMEKEIIIL